LSAGRASGSGGRRLEPSEYRKSLTLRDRAICALREDMLLTLSEIRSLQGNHLSLRAGSYLIVVHRPGDRLVDRREAAPVPTSAEGRLKAYIEDQLTMRVRLVGVQTPLFASPRSAGGKRHPLSFDSIRDVVRRAQRRRDRRGRKPEGVDWSAARQLYEAGKPYEDIAGELKVSLNRFRFAVRWLSGRGLIDHAKRREAQRRAGIRFGPPPSPAILYDQAELGALVAKGCSPRQILEAGILRHRDGGRVEVWHVKARIRLLEGAAERRRGDEPPT
jgi:hypothetical protein